MVPPDSWWCSKTARTAGVWNVKNAGIRARHAPHHAAAPDCPAGALAPLDEQVKTFLTLFLRASRSTPQMGRTE
ncbi:MAG: hypothetical protein ACR5LC_12025 [Symbiopectobacterium sp.]|uniref:hypothetical protein n=1 Tax=Symbiopectobacterium sp. TaxID=2952789 RepID=UPI003F3A6893